MFKPFSDLQNVFVELSESASFVDQFCLFCFMFVFVIPLCLFLAAFRSPVGKGLTSWLFWFLFSCVLSFYHMCLAPHQNYG